MHLYKLTINEGGPSEGAPKNPYDKGASQNITDVHFSQR